MAKRSFTDTTLAIDTLAKLHQKDHEGVSYQDAVKMVLSEHSELAREYKAKPEPEPEDPSKYAQARTYIEARDSLMEQAEELSLRLGIDGNLAFKRVLTLDRNRLLARRYLVGPSKRERQGM